MQRTLCEWLSYFEFELRLIHELVSGEAGGGGVARWRPSPKVAIAPCCRMRGPAHLECPYQERSHEWLGASTNPFTPPPAQ